MAGKDLELPELKLEDEAIKSPSPPRGANGERAKKAARELDDNGASESSEGAGKKSKSGSSHSEGHQGNAAVPPATAELTMEMKQDARKIRGFLELSAQVPADLLCTEEALRLADLKGQHVQQKQIFSQTLGKVLGDGFGQIGTKFLSLIPITPELRSCEVLIKKLDEYWTTIVEKVTPEDRPLFIQVFKVPNQDKASIMIWRLAPTAEKRGIHLCDALREQQVTNDLEKALYEVFKQKGWEVRKGFPPTMTKE